MPVTFYHNVKKFIRDVQRSDVARRKKWFIGGSFISVLFILILWVIYVNIGFPAVEPSIPAIEKNIQTQTEQNSADESMFQIFERGIKNISNDFKKQYDVFKEHIEKGIGSLRSGLERKNTMYIQGARLNFVLDGLDPIPSTHLPQ